MIPQNSQGSRTILERNSWDPYVLVWALACVVHREGNGMEGEPTDVHLQFKCMSQARPSLLLITVIYTRTKGNFIFHLTVHLQGKTRQKPGDWNWRRVSGRTQLTGLLSVALLSSPGPPRHDPAAVSCALPHQPLMRNMPRSLSYRPFRYRQFLHWGSLFADNTGLGRVNHTQSVRGSYRELGSQIRQL